MAAGIRYFYARTSVILSVFGMVQISQIPGNIDLWMVAPLLELCHPQAALEAATQD